MTRITQPTRLDRVQYTIGSGTRVLDFAVEGENDHYTWDGNEDAHWQIDDVAYIENVEEDRFIIYPEGEFFTYEIVSEDVEGNTGPVQCWSK